MATASVLSNAHVPDNLLCPVCFELPLEEVLQCKDGHIICKSCCSKLTACPQCRIPFGKEEIRCRVFEAMLEDIKLECPFKQAGCSRKLFRNYVKTHIELCWFNYEKFGKPVHLCRLIGFEDCTFRANQGSTDTALKHFTNKHQFPTVSGLKFNLEINNFQILSGGGRNGVQFLKPFLLDLKPDCVLLLFTVLKKEFISWLPLYLPYVNPTDGTFSKRPLFNVEFFISGSDPYTPLSWSLSPTNIIKAGSFLPDIPFQIPISKIQDFTVNGTLRVKCTVKKKELEEKKEKKGKVETVQMSLSEAFGVSSRATPGNTLPVPFQMPGQSQPPPQQKPGLPSKLAKQQGMGITRSVPVLNLSKIPNNPGTSSKRSGKAKKLQPSNHWDWNWGY